MGFSLAGLLALGGAAAYSLRRQVTFDVRYTCAFELVLPQLTVLLQLVQLWSVLSRLAQPLEEDLDLDLVNTTVAGQGY